MSAFPTSSTKRRLSIFRRSNPSPLSQINTTQPSEDPPRKVLQKKERSFSWLSQASNKSSDTDSEPNAASQRTPRRLRIPQRSSIIQSRSKDEHDDALWSATSGHSQLSKWGDVRDPQSGSVIHHGEVQTSGGIWRKTREYLVLTDKCLFRFKSQAKAAATFPAIPVVTWRHSRHSSSPTVRSVSEIHSPLSPDSYHEDFGDRSSRIELNRVVAVNNRFDARPFFALELHWVDDSTAETRSLILQLMDPESKGIWLSLLSKHTKEAAGGRDSFIHPRHFDRIRRYDVASDIADPCADNVFLVIRHTVDTSAQPNSPAALERSTVNTMLLAVGSNRIHLLPLAVGERAQSFGLVALFGMDMAEFDDCVTLTLRPPLQPVQEILIASLRSQDLVCAIYRQLKVIRPNWQIKLCSISASAAMRRRMSDELDSDARGLAAFSRTLNAYLVGYGRAPDAVRYEVKTNMEGAQTFKLVSPDGRRYGYLELLATARALYYSNCFEAISFADVCLDELNLSFDEHGSEHLNKVLQKIFKSRGQSHELSYTCLLTQEIAAIACTNRKLLRLDFSNSISVMPLDGNSSHSGILKALSFVCPRELTNVERLSFHGMRLSDMDLECLWLLADEKRSHLRGLDLSRTGIGQQKLTNLFNALKEQENTLESLNLSDNGACLSQCSFDLQIRPFSYLHFLDLSHLILSTEILEPLIEASTFRLWRLHELRMSSTYLNAATIQSLCLYLQDSNSKSLKALHLENTGMGGDAVSALMRAMTTVPGKPRELNLFVGENPIEESIESFAAAFKEGLSPTSLSISKTKFQQEASLRLLFDAVRQNTSTKILNMANIRLFASADLSESTLGAIQRAFARNENLTSIDISGNYSDALGTDGQLNPGLKYALIGLSNRCNLETLKINNQKLYYDGAFMLAEVLHKNQSMTEVHCENGNITLAGMDELLKTIKDHPALQYFSDTEDSKRADMDELGESNFKTKLEPAPSKAKQVLSGVEGKLSTKISGKSKRQSLSQVWSRSSGGGVATRNWEDRQAMLKSYLRRNQRKARGEPEDEDEDFASQLSIDAKSDAEKPRVLVEGLDPDAFQPVEKDGIETKSNASTNVSSYDGKEFDGLVMKNLKI